MCGARRPLRPRTSRPNVQVRADAVVQELLIPKLGAGVRLPSPALETKKAQVADLGLLRHRSGGAGARGLSMSTVISNPEVELNVATLPDS